MSSSHRFSRSLAVVALSAAALATTGASVALAGPTVTVRVEGESATLLPRTTVTLNAPEPVSNCAANSVAAAINLAVGGNWDHGESEGSAGDFTETILGETHEFLNDGDTWAEWVDYKWGGGICTDLLNEGDEVLMVADHEPEPTFAPSRWPLIVTGVPTTAQVGVPFTVQISEVRTAPGTFASAGEGTPTPVAGATIEGVGVSSSTSDASGNATVTLTSAGSTNLRAVLAGDAPSATLPVCVHNGNDGFCGTTAPSGATITPAPTTTAAYNGPFAVVAKATDVLEGHIYTPAKAPRVLSGTVASHTQVASVDLRLRRSYRGRCYAYNGKSERFARAHCGSGSFFKVASTASFSYLLPGALAPGRYVLDLEATDAAGHRSTLARGTSRIVFYVR
jgi:hypothetical protein